MGENGTGFSAKTAFLFLRAGDSSGSGALRRLAAGAGRVSRLARAQRSVIRGTLTGPTGERREFHGWLSSNTALQAILATGAEDATKTYPRSPRPVDN